MTQPQPSGAPMSADDWISALDLHPHPEGGHYKQVYRATQIISQANLPASFAGDRAAATAIYFLLKEGEISAFHRLQADELWHFYTGCPLEIHVITLDSQYSRFELGLDLVNGQRPMQVIPGGVWFGACLKPSTGQDDATGLAACFTLIGCTVTPGFDFEDFELAERDTLLQDFPEHHNIIKQLTP
ncbi:MAG: cupin domain-containing protein [Deinococcota bacterium]